MPRGGGGHGNRSNQVSSMDILRVRFFTKIQIRIFNPKTGSSSYSNDPHRIDTISPICNGLRAKFPHRNIYFHGFNQSSHHKVFSDPQQGHEYSRFFGIYVEIFQMQTSRQQNHLHIKIKITKYRLKISSVPQYRKSPCLFLTVY